MRMAGRCLPAILLILPVVVAAPPALAETYKWVDENGVVNYSNAPPAKAARRQLVEERISIVPADPSLGPAIAAMRARAARDQAYEEADYERRQRYMFAAQANYPGSNCPYGADCSMGYAPAYYPYAYGGPAFITNTGRRFAPVAMQRTSLPASSRVAMHTMHPVARGPSR